MKEQASKAMTDHGIDVVYRLDRIALEIASKMHEQGLLHVSGSADGDDGLSMNGPSALVMVQGKTAKQAHNAVNEAGIASVMPSRVTGASTATRVSPTRPSSWAASPRESCSRTPTLS